MSVIDIHTHMLTLDWIELLREHGGGKYGVKKTPANQDAVMVVVAGAASEALRT